MRHLKTFAAGLLLASSAVAVAADRDAELRLTELLSSDVQYQQTWQKVVEQEDRLPEWVINLSGTAPPMTAVENEGDRYLVGELCEAHDCFNQRLYVAFSWDKDAAYALYVQLPQGLAADQAPSRHASLRWLGKPDAELQMILQERLSADPNWN